MPAQGTLRSWSAKNGKGLIRNYGAVWADMLKQQQEQGKEQQHQGRGQLVNVTVLGRGSYEDLGVPPKLASRVVFHSDLPYPVRGFGLGRGVGVGLGRGLGRGLVAHGRGWCVG